MRRIKVLIGGSPALARLLRHLFDVHPEFEIVGDYAGSKDLEIQAARLLPELIVANVKPVSTAAGCVAAAIKRSSPASKLILIFPFRDLMSAARKSGADACLHQENLVLRLVPAAIALSARTRAPALKK